jgi:glycosyltransferase involved in cell wall biosynthesis
MRILFIYSKLGLGGIDTLIVRMSTHLSKAGHDVHIMLREKPDRIRYSDPQLINEARKSSTIIYAGDKCINLLKSFSLDLHHHYDYIYCFDRTTFLIGLILEQRFNLKIPVIAGVYSPREYSFQSHRFRYIKNLMDKVFNKLPPENIFFMNQACKEAHAKVSKKDLSLSPIVPLPVDVERFAHSVRRSSKEKIVSIGRIVNWKTYNFIMVDVIEYLAQKGYNFEYHIYGHGDQIEKLNQYILDKNLADRIYIHGPLAYTNIPLVLEDAFLFIGMGTSLVEAAACGVPSLIAIESNQSATTYGFFHEVDMGYSVGEVIPDLPMFPIAQKIEEICTYDMTKYLEIQMLSREKATIFAMNNVMHIFLDTLQTARPYRYTISYTMALINAIDDIVWKILRRIGIPDPLANQWFHKNRTKE